MGRPKSSFFETISSVFSTFKAEIMRDLRVATFARVTAVSENTLNAQPIVKEKISTKKGYEYMALPELVDIPYLSSQYPKIGDYVVCLHFDRSIDNLDIFNDRENLVESGENRHNINDSIALVVNTDGGWREEYIVNSNSTTTIKIDGIKEIRVVLYNTSGAQTGSEIFLKSDGDISYGNLTISVSTGRVVAGSLSNSGRLAKICTR